MMVVRVSLEKVIRRGRFKGGELQARTLEIDQGLKGSGGLD